MSVPNGALLRASARFSTAGFGDLVNVFTFQCVFTANQTDSDVFDAVDAHLSDIYNQFDLHMATQVEPLDLKVDIIEFQAGEFVVTYNVGFGSWGATLNTAETADALPSGVAVLGKLRTGLGKHWGRKWLGVFTELNNNVGYVTSTLQTAVASGLVKLVTAYIFNTDQGIRGVVLDQQSGLARQIMEVAVNSVWSYQRRRRTGVGS